MNLSRPGPGSQERVVRWRKKINSDLERIRFERLIGRASTLDDPWIVITAAGRVGRWVWIAP